jgi:hypothetical protein
MQAVEIVQSVLLEICGTVHRFVCQIGTLNSNRE